MTLLSHLRRGWVYLFGKPGPVARERLKADRQRQADAEALRKRIKADKAINHQPSPKPQNPTLPRMPAEGEVVEVHEGGRFSVVPGEYQPPEPDTPRPRPGRTCGFYKPCSCCQDRARIGGECVA